MKCDFFLHCVHDNQGFNINFNEVMQTGSLAHHPKQ